MLGFRLSGDLDRLRGATRTGRLFGTDNFVAELETKLDRSLFPNKPGPNPKANTVGRAAHWGPLTLEFGG